MIDVVERDEPYLPDHDPIWSKRWPLIRQQRLSVLSNTLLLTGYQMCWIIQ